MCHVSPLGSWSHAASISGLSLQQPHAFQLWLLHNCLSASGFGGEGPIHSLWYLPNHLFYEQMCQRSLSCIRAFHRIVFCLFVCWLVFLVIPWFGLLSHVSSLRLSSWHSSPVLTLKTDDAVRASLSNTHSLIVKASVWATSLLAVADRCIFCSFVCLFLFVSPGYVTLWDSKTLHRPACERDSYCVGTSPLSQLPSQEGSPPLNVLSLFLSFILCPTSFQKEWSAFLGAWCPPPAFISCFVEVSQHSNDLLMNLWGINWSPHPIPPPSLDCLLKLSFKKGVQEYSIGKRKSLHCIGKTGYPYEK